MAKISKRKKEWKKELDSTKKYDFGEAIGLVKKYAKSKFTEGIDAVFRLGVDPRKADQIVRGSCTLPHGTGKVVRVLAFAKGEQEKEALDAGADYVGGEDLAAKIKEGWLEFDRVVASPDMMGIVGKIGRILGPRGLMPNPKLGTVTQAIGDVVSMIKKGQIQFRTDKGANVHALVGLTSFSDEKIKENIRAFYDSLMKLKPASAKGTYMKNISISSTMGPGIKVEPTDLKE